jgi:DNA repair protein RadC
MHNSSPTSDAKPQLSALALIPWLTSDQDSEFPPDYLLDVLLAHSGEQLMTIGTGARLLREFGSIGAALSAEKSQLCRAFQHDNQTHRIVDQLYGRLKAVAKLINYILAEEIQERPIITSWQQLLKYLKVSLGYKSTEHIRIIFLDKNNFLIKDELHHRGTVDHTPIYTREIAKRSLELNASAIIMVHNHPSGDLTPSASDLVQTKLVRSALNSLGIILHDHLIIGPSGHFSFKSAHLI